MELWPVIRYVVVVVGETTWDPLRATFVPLRSAVAQLNVVQVSVALPPELIEVVFALMPAVHGPLEPTVTVADEVAVVPLDALAMKV